MLGIELIRGVTRRLGVDVVRYHPVPPDFAADDRALFEYVVPYTLTSPERVSALANAVRWVVREEIPGAMVECGVWRGGSMMAVARTLLSLGAADRDLYLFDTFTGMSDPTEEDRDLRGVPADRRPGIKKHAYLSARFGWGGIDDVRANLASTGYPTERLHFVAGRVEDTLPGSEPGSVPEQIAVLRLDTDWYVSTRHELLHLWPRLVVGGICIIDDYGHWAGARKAVDEYFAEHGVHVLMHRVDYTARLIVKD